MIVGYVGPLGSGKTLAAVRDAYRWSLAARGAPVWGNLHIESGPWASHRQANPHHRIGRLQLPGDLVRMVTEGGGIAILDEVHQSLDARMSLGLQNILLTQLMVFMRKIGVTVLYTTQHESQVDKRLRGVTDLMTTCMAFGPREAKVHRYERWDYQARTPLQRWELSVDEASPFYSMYRTWEFTKRFTLPSKIDAFDRLMEQLQEAAKFAREYSGDPDLAWETFLSESGYTSEEISGGSRKMASGRRTRTPPHRTGRSRVHTEASGALELAETAPGEDGRSHR